MFDWNDLKAFLAVAREGSTLGAAKALGVNQTTVARRIEILEQKLGLKLIERGPAGARLTEAGRALLPEAEKVERAVAGLSSRAAAHQRSVTGTIRVTAAETVVNTTVMPALPEFRRLYPGVTVELIVTDELLDIAAGEADVAVRGGTALEDSDLVVRKLADFDFALYCSRAYARSRGYPTSGAQLREHALIGGEGALGSLPGLRWMFEQAPSAEVHCRSNTMTNLFAAVKAGLGVAPLPCISADMDPDLVQCMPPDPAFAAAVWILTRPELKEAPRVRAFIDFLAPHFTALRRDLLDQGRAVRASVSESLATPAPAEAPLVTPPA